MNLIENLRMALSSILSHKLRSILTMLGIIIGVGSVIVVVAAGQGGEQMLKQTISGPGNTVEIYYQPSNEELTSNPNAYLDAGFTEEDIRSLNSLEGVKHVVAKTTESMNVRFRDEKTDAAVNGINDGYISINSMEVEK